MRTADGRRLVAVNLVVGRLSGADPESLDFAMGLMVGESAWPGAAVCIREEPLRLVCAGCGRGYEADLDRLACPACGSMDVEVTAGRDLRLESLEVE